MVVTNTWNFFSLECCTLFELYIRYICIYLCMYVCIYVYMYMCVCMYVYVCVCMYVCSWCVCVCMYVCSCGVCVCVCVCVCTVADQDNIFRRGQSVCVKRHQHPAVKCWGGFLYIFQYLGGGGPLPCPYIGSWYVCMYSFVCVFRDEHIVVGLD